MIKFINYFLIFLLVLTLTITTQVGGIILLLSLWISKRWKQTFRFKKLIIFLSIYVVSTFAVVPFLAPYFDREKIEASDNLKSGSFMTVLMNRNYVNPELNTLLKQISINTPIVFLDANFPFFDGFPLLPHLSHNDGRKVDLSFIYKNENGELIAATKSVSGYGVFENPDDDEFNQTNFCKENGYFQYDYPKYLTFGTKNKYLTFSKEGTANLIREIVGYNSVEKVFIEPHLVKRMNLRSDKIRFHGCRAVRHDDHIHVQVNN